MNSSCKEGNRPQAVRFAGALDFGAALFEILRYSSGDIGSERVHLFAARRIDRRELAARVVHAIEKQHVSVYVEREVAPKSARILDAEGTGPLEIESCTRADIGAKQLAA